jgi:hypothetical protein
MILYVRKNEETSCLKIVHFHDGEEGIPSEMEANAKSQCIARHFAAYTYPVSAVLDEQFPEITIDLVRRPLALFLNSRLTLVLDFGPWRVYTLERRCAFPPLANSSLSHFHELS